MDIKPEDILSFNVYAQILSNTKRQYHLEISSGSVVETIDNTKNFWNQASLNFVGEKIAELYSKGRSLDKKIVFEGKNDLGIILTDNNLSLKDSLTRDEKVDLLQIIDNCLKNKN